jgi:hypothetical protein
MRAALFWILLSIGVAAMLSMVQLGPTPANLPRQVRP